MLTHPIISVVVAAVLGVLTGLGTGGGSLLILWLTMVVHMEPAMARGINLLFFLPSALLATLLRIRSGTIPFRKLLLPIASGCAAALVFSLLGQKINTGQLKKLFGVLLIYIGLRELFYRPRKPR